jgi:hypothetical protein
MDDSLLRYLNDHLAGSAGAIGLIQKLATSAEDPAEAHFFHDLERKVESDRALLKELIGRLGETSSTVLEAAGSITGAAGRLKLNWEGMEPGCLGRFEAMEVLALGIQGKRLLWLVLAELAPFIPEWAGTDFAELELQALDQRDAVEALRIEAGRDALLDAARRVRRPRGADQPAR